MYNGTICSSDITINHLLARHVSSNYEKTVRVQVFWELPRDADHQTFCYPMQQFYFVITFKFYEEQEIITKRIVLHLY